jgi:hypothetical protein
MEFQDCGGVAEQDVKGPCKAGTAVVNVYLTCPAISALSGASRVRFMNRLPVEGECG